MLWKGHRALARFACSKFFPKDIVERVVEYSIYPDEREVWKKCASRYRGKKAWMDPDCPPPPPVHHTVKWSFRAVEYYSRLARMDLKRRDMESFAKHMGIALHFVGDAIIEPYIIDWKDLEGEWAYHAKADPISDYVAEMKEPPHEDNWYRWRNRVYMLVPIIFPEDYMYARLDEIRGRFQRTMDYVWAGNQTVSFAIGLCHVVKDGWFKKCGFLRAFSFALGFNPCVWVIFNHS